MEYSYLTEAEIEFCESWFIPKCLIESLFHDFNNLSDFKKDKFGEVRPYQMPFLSDECLVDFDTTAEYYGLNKKESFELRKNVGNIFCFGARKFGKTMMVETMDLILTMLTTFFGLKSAFSSVDLVHIREVLDNVKNCFQGHAICKLFTKRISGAPDYKFEMKTGFRLNSVNFNIGAKNPGQQWYGKHVERVYIEEASLETEEVYNKRQDALSEFGAVFRVSGMTDFTPYSPPGRAFYSGENQKWVINLPQFVNPYWDEKEKQDRIEYYGGEDSINYKVFVKGEVVEDGCSAFDMERIRKFCYRFNKAGNHIEEVKRTEISKERYKHFKNMLVVNRPKNADRIFVNADIGEKVTEIIIHSEFDDKYKYLHNIVLYNLTDEEQYEVFKYIIEQIDVNVLGIDCGDGMGRAIYRRLEKIVPVENLVWYDGSMKIDVDFEKDEQGKVLLEKGKPVYRKEYMSEWSVKRLQDIFYNGRCIIPKDAKFESQFSVVMGIVTGGRTKYSCVSSTGDHLFDAFKIFGIATWLKKDFNLTKPIARKWGIGASSWKK